MTYTVRGTVQFVVEVDDDDATNAMDTGDMDDIGAGASAFARESIATLTDSIRISRGCDFGAINIFEVSVLCEACGENDAGDYTLGAHHVCPTCTIRALTWRVFQSVVYDVVNGDKHAPNMPDLGEFDVPLARTLAMFDEMDDAMRTSGIAYVDSFSNAHDDINGCDANDVHARIVRDIVPVLVTAFMVHRPR